MNQATPARWASLFGLTMFLASQGATSLSAAESVATVAEAAAVLNLSTLALPGGAQPPQHRNMAGLSYTAQGDVKGTFEFHQKQFAAGGWSQLPNAYVSDQSASATFSRSGFLLSLMVFPSGKPGEASVSVIQHGNVKLDRLPVPPGVKPFYGGPVSTAYLAETPVKETAEACKRLLLDAGWQPYGTAGDSQFFKQNAVRLTATVAAAPAQGGKTVITYSTELMSVDLPAPAETDRLQYADVTTQLNFDTRTNQSDLVEFYRAALAKSGWQATTSSPITDRGRSELLFRNPAKDMLTLTMQEVEGKIRASLKHQSAAELAEIERRVKEEVARKNTEKDKPAAKLSLSLPAEATDVQQTKSRIEFHLAPGRAKAAIASWRKQLAADGWKERVSALDAMAGAVDFERENQHLSVMYTDTGIMPAEITVQAIGLELNAAKGQ